DRLKRTDHIIRTFLGEKALVETRAKVPIISLIVLVAIKTPDSADNNQGADPIVPEIAEIVKTEIGSGISALKTNMIINDQLRQAVVALTWFSMGAVRLGSASMVAKLTHLPFCVDDAAVVG